MKKDRKIEIRTLALNLVKAHSLISMLLDLCREQLRLITKIKNDRDRLLEDIKVQAKVIEALQRKIPVNKETIPEKLVNEVTEVKKYTKVVKSPIKEKDGKFYV